MKPSNQPQTFLPSSLLSWLSDIESTGALWLVVSFKVFNLRMSADSLGRIFRAIYILVFPGSGYTGSSSMKNNFFFWLLLKNKVRLALNITISFYFIYSFFFQIYIVFSLLIFFSLDLKKNCKKYIDVKPTVKWETFVLSGVAF